MSECCQSHAITLPEQWLSHGAAKLAIPDHLFLHICFYRRRIQYGMFLLSFNGKTYSYLWTSFFALSCHSGTETIRNPPLRTSLAQLLSCMCCLLFISLPVLAGSNSPSLHPQGARCMLMRVTSIG